METPLDALPGRPLSAEDVATLNDATTVRVLPFTWFGEQVIAALLLHDPRADSDEEGDPNGEDGSETDLGDSTDEEATEDDPFGGRDDGIGTVEVIGDEAVDERASGDETGNGRASSDEGTTESVAGHAEGGPSGTEEDLSVFAVGYDDSASSWVLIAEIDPDAQLTDAEAPIRSWARETYHSAIVDRFAIGPSEYELDYGRKD